MRRGDGSDERPLMVVLDASPAVTGGLRSAMRMAEILQPWVRTVLVLPAGATVDERALTMFEAVERLPMVQLRKSAGAITAYFPALLRSGWSLGRLLQRRRVGILVVNDFFLLQGWVARRLGFRGKLVTFVRFDPLRFPAPVRRMWLGAARSSRVVAVSRFIAGRLPAMAAETVYESIDPALGPGPRDMAACKDVVVVGNYIRGKGQDHALEVFARIAERFPDTRLVFHGGDLGLAKNRAFKAGLERRAAELGLAGRVRFGGFVDDLRDAYAGARVALNLSESESFSLTCLEASQLGLPVVAFRSGGPEEIIEDGRTGFLCTLYDLDAVATALSALLDDPGRAERMGEAGTELVRDRFGPERYGAAMRRLLQL